MRTLNMKEKLSPIYDFLLANRQYNHALQEKEYISMLSGHDNKTDKVISLLYNIVNSQSQPKMDYLAKFFMFIYEDKKLLDSFRAFVKKVSGKDNGCYIDLYKGLKEKDGWGPKTAALFTKVIFNLHRKKHPENLTIWADAPNGVNGSDQIFLPVDAVIIEIFKQIGFEKNNFSSINKVISTHYSASEVEVWDDLWFWGFITQKGSGGKRTIEWNLNKYWSLQHSNKDAETIKIIQKKAEIFMEFLS